MERWADLKRRIEVLERSSESSKTRSADNRTFETPQSMLGYLKEMKASYFLQEVKVVKASLEQAGVCAKDAAELQVKNIKKRHKKTVKEFEAGAVKAQQSFDSTARKAKMGILAAFSSTGKPKKGGARGPASKEVDKKGGKGAAKAKKGGKVASSK
jgi:hypothetical protein